MEGWEEGKTRRLLTIRYETQRSECNRLTVRSHSCTLKNFSEDGTESGVGVSRT